MNDQQLINQLKTFKNIHPDRDWVVLTRSYLSAEISHKSAAISGGLGLFKFNFIVPKPLAIPVMAALVALVGGATFLANGGQARLPFGGQDGVFVASVRHKSLSAATKQELKEIAKAVKPTNEDKSANSVVFNKDGDKQESFKNALRNRIEAKIGKVKDLFAQLEDENLSRQIPLNPRRYKENFRLADAAIAEQVKSILSSAEAALAEGNLIDALDFVNAIDKLLDAD